MPVLLLCVLIWSDSYPVPSPQRLPWTREVKVEYCQTRWETRVEVRTRIIRETWVSGELTTEEIFPWTLQASHYLGDGHGRDYDR